jgi:hypothetical protein
MLVEQRLLDAKYVGKYLNRESMNWIVKSMTNKDFINYIKKVEASAILIQKHVRGVISRNKTGVNNPYCENGKKFILRMFATL